MFEILHLRKLKNDDFPKVCDEAHVSLQSFIEYLDTGDVPNSVLLFTKKFLLFFDSIKMYFTVGTPNYRQNGVQRVCTQDERALFIAIAH